MITRIGTFLHPLANLWRASSGERAMLATLVSSHRIKPTAVQSRLRLPFMSVEVKTIEPGDGKTFPLPGQRVSAHYTGRLVDGTVFDTSRKDFNRPFSFQIGVGSVIKGWDVGIAKMSTGEKAELTIEPSHGYGKRGAPPTIPGDATLIFEVELISVSGTPREEW
jgi:FK506-binding protein 1